MPGPRAVLWPDPDLNRYIPQVGHILDIIFGKIACHLCLTSQKPCNHTPDPFFLKLVRQLVQVGLPSEDQVFLCLVHHLLVNGPGPVPPLFHLECSLIGQGIMLAAFGQDIFPILGQIIIIQIIGCPVTQRHQNAFSVPKASRSLPDQTAPAAAGSNGLNSPPARVGQSRQNPCRPGNGVWGSRPPPAGVPHPFF